MRIRFTKGTPSSCRKDVLTGLSGRYWPYHPSPLDGELFSSWLIRIAEKNSPRLHSFCHHHWPGRSIWNRDIDKLGGKDIANDIAKKTGTKVSMAHKTFLQSFEGIVFEKLNPYGNSRWILPLGIYHRTHRQFGQQYCPQCLTEDNIPYLRKVWRLAFVTTCTQHGNLLMDRCCCGSPMVPHRNKLTECHICFQDIRNIKPHAAHSSTLQLQYHLQSILGDHIPRLGNKPINPIIYFDILRQICRILTSGAKAKQLRKAIYNTYGGATIKHSYGKIFEFLDVNARHSILSLASNVLDGWPYKFVGVCLESKCWSSWVMQDMNPKRFDLDNISQYFLSPAPIRESSSPSDFK